MANTSTPNGLVPRFMLDGSPYNGATVRCVIPSGDGTATFIGDAVKLSGTSIGGYPTVIQAAAGNEVFGVVTSFEFDPTDLSKQYRAASTQRYCRVVPALDVIFEVQEDAVGGALAITAVGEMADIVVGSGSTSSGLSGMQLDSSTSSSSAATLQILGFVDRADNEPASANAKVLVRIAESSLRGDPTGV